jgi:hypothetical protein
LKDEIERRKTKLKKWHEKTTPVNLS